MDKREDDDLSKTIKKNFFCWDKDLTDKDLIDKDLTDESQNFW